ncbi:MAG: peptidase M23 [Hydrogenophilales bacterium CG17_big_fil_post_rev_8_21_14_2_50_63_12]|nr:MAG: peptidase M23 [Hydrogenophilales bacterium CG17_big_fil_post_rev_8_21_14_2_50_63_12]PIX97532.1 MAG: peptidase M23 [Hydrogenophilales bacterium CG_4_10_14_3_um_filter_63_21]PJB02698.1 MAG: peptidase M23 [Hydrogenophilales bacterium CG_4_9_14_3_um_filter_63_34]
MTPKFTRKHLFLALAALPFMGVVAAFGIAPDTTTENLPRETVVESVALPQAQATDSGTFDFWREERIGRGDTLQSLLARLGVEGEEARYVLAAAQESKFLGRLAPGRSVLARVTSTGQLMLFRYLVSDEKLVTVTRAGGKFQVNEQPVALESRQILRSGEIEGSLFGATDAADVPDRIASEMAEALSGDIDFHKDLRRGDHFSVVYEAFYLEGQLVKTGRMLAAEFVNQGKSYQALYFKDAQGREGYFTPDGQSLKRAFLKSPMPFSRISSGFSGARFHPVLQRWRAHKGIDYAAPTGAPVRAVADAKVEFVGRQGGYGNLIVLKHQGSYSTAYGHLSRFGKGIKRGTPIGQGQVIGYVGATGLATGPHLHYEFRVHNVQQNPLALKLPTSYPLDSHAKAQFAAKAQPLVANLGLLRNSNLASLD